MMPQILDDFEDVSAWTAVASGAARLRISRDAGPRGGALRLDFDFAGGGGFVVARREIALALPESWDLGFQIRGAAPRNGLELKLVDASGRNVWWHRREALVLPEAWQALEIRDDAVSFAWGPAGGGRIRQLGAIELAIVAGLGGKGSVWIADLRLEDRSAHPLPRVRASSSLPGHPPENVFDGSPATSWRSEPAPAPQSLLVDFGEDREWSGLVVRWERSGRARAFVVRTSADGGSWDVVHAARDNDSERSHLYLPATKRRYLRLDLETSAEGRGFGIAEIEIRPRAFAASVNDFFASVAAEEPRGWYPKYLYGEQTYWSPVGLPDAADRAPAADVAGPHQACALLNEEGMVEVDRAAFSIEPFLVVDGRLLTWADVRILPELEGGYLPIPSSVWQAGEVVLRTTAFAHRGRDGPTLYVRYRVENTRRPAAAIRLFAVIRPFQVTPPWQAFEDLGGVSPVTALDYRAGVVRVERRAGRRRAVARRSRSAPPPSSTGRSSSACAAATVPVATHVADPRGWACGALRFDLDLAPAATAEVELAVPSARARRRRVGGRGRRHRRGVRRVGAAVDVRARRACASRSRSPRAPTSTRSGP